MGSEDERKLYIIMLGKLHISTAADPDKLKAIAALVTDAIEDKAADATSRNTLAKVETAVGKALKSGSRSKSIAPSVVGDDDDRTVLDEDGSDEQINIDDASVVGDETQLPTPLPSPQKARKTKPARELESKPRRPREHSVQVSEDERQPMRESSTTGLVEGLGNQDIKEEHSDDEDTPRPQQRTIKLEEDTLAPASDAGEVVADDTEVAVQPEPAKRPRGRPPKNPTQAPPRKSVRSGRRRAASMAVEESATED